MKLLLSNFVTEVDPVEVSFPGNPLLTYDTLRSGAAGIAEPDGSGETIAQLDANDHWVVLGVEGTWTDLEVIG